MIDGADGPSRDDDGASTEVRPGLSRSGIVRTAIALTVNVGLARLTMRRLGAECGVEAMALYRYVHSREDLLTGIVDELVDRLYADQLAARRDEDGWQDYLQRLAHGVRAIAVEHPDLFPLVCTRAPEAPWVRPPLRSLRWMESFLETLLASGFDDDGAVAAYRTYTTFLLGHLLLEVAERGTGPGSTDGVGAGARRTVDLREYPHLQRLQHRLSQDHSRAEFEEALEAVLDRIEILHRGP